MSVRPVPWPQREALHAACLALEPGQPLPDALDRELRRFLLASITRTPRTFAALRDLALVDRAHAGVIAGALCDLSYDGRIQPVELAGLKHWRLVRIRRAQMSAALEQLAAAETTYLFALGWKRSVSRKKRQATPGSSWERAERWIHPKHHARPLDLDAAVILQKTLAVRALAGAR